ncbi:hypothetical protein EJB05_50471, partial [Eragrostis curvula]
DSEQFPWRAISVEEEAGASQTQTSPREATAAAKAGGVAATRAAAVTVATRVVAAARAAAEAAAAVTRAAAETAATTRVDAARAVAAAAIVLMMKARSLRKPTSLALTIDDEVAGRVQEHFLRICDSGLGVPTVGHVHRRIEEQTVSSSSCEILP